MNIRVRVALESFLCMRSALHEDSVESFAPTSRSILTATVVQTCPGIQHVASGLDLCAGSREVGGGGVKAEKRYDRSLHEIY